MRLAARIRPEPLGPRGDPSDPQTALVFLLRFYFLRTSVGLGGKTLPDI